MYCIKSTGETDYYLCWNDANGGYFFTSKDVIAMLLENNTDEHPFMFGCIEDAEEFLKSKKIKSGDLIIAEWEDTKSIITEPWIQDWNSEGEDTESIRLDVDDLLTVSDLIKLLQEAKRKWGDKKIMIYDSNYNSACGFSRLFLSHGFDTEDNTGPIHVDDTIRIWA